VLFWLGRRALGARAAALGLSAFALAFFVSIRASAGDPRLEWRTVETPHFRVHFHGGLETLAQKTAGTAEAVRERLATVLGRAPTEVTHILLRDVSDGANGDATAIPYDAIRLYVTAPEDLSSLGDYDDWATALVTHEQTHVFHLDNIGGPAAIVNAIIGKTYAPNQIQPRWITEGIAVAMESRFTSGGRLRSPLFDMYLRADVLDHHVAGLDEMSHSVRRWPGGDLWYLYGGRFFGWILETYGDDVFSAVAQDYGENLVPWGVNRSIRRATGRTYPELYRGFIQSLQERYAAQARAVTARGLRIGARLTTSGRIAYNPRFVPGCARTNDQEALLYSRDDGQDRPGLYRLPLLSRSRADEANVELVARTGASFGTASFDPACGFVFDSLAPSAWLYDWDDLHYQPRGTTSESGFAGSRRRLTTGLRARSPDVSPDGRQVTFVTNHAGTSTLRIADVDDQGALGHVRRLVPSATYEQAASPRFSPDGKRLAYSAWTAGGYRDVRVVDVATGRFFELMHDRASDMAPTWTPDGRFVLFSSDRSGIANVYAYELASGRLRQVTNVLSGAFMPEVSPDGKTLVYVGYGSGGFDLYSLPLDQGAWLEPADAAPPRPSPPTAPLRVDWPVTEYDPWSTLRPRALEFEYAPRTFGNTLTITARGTDITGNHGVAASLSYAKDVSEVTGSLSYTYNRLPVSLDIQAFRALAVRGPISIDGQTYPVRDEILGATTGISYPILGEFDSQTVSLSYTVSANRPSYAIGRALEPYADSRARPGEVFLGSVRVGWSYSNAFRPLYGISAERGVFLSLSSDFAGTPTASDATLVAVDARAIGYLRAPWLQHHVFALALSGGAAAGSFPGRGYYYSGGFAETNTFDDVTTGLRQSAFVLRGFPAGAFVGRQFNLANLEYRFPILWLDRGVSTLPAFFHGTWGTFFADYGGAYDEIDPKDLLAPYHLGIGGELNFEFTLGYFLETGFRLGIAKGFGDAAISGTQTYAVVAASF
jgi:hypothetical protein